MYFDEELSEKEEERIIEELANYIHLKGLETAAMLLLESSKPFALIGGRMSRLFLSPFLSVFGDVTDIFGQKMIIVLEKRKNIERLIQIIEEKKSVEKEKIE